VVRQLRLIRESLTALKFCGNTPIGPVGQTIDGRLTVRLFPGNAIDGMLFKNITAEAHMRAGVTTESFDKELHYQAEDAATSYLMNASFMYCAAKMLVLPKGWAGSDAFVQVLQEKCAKVAPRPAYYPGAADRWLKLTTGRARMRASHV
jgi:hypothetical protein